MKNKLVNNSLKINIRQSKYILVFHLLLFFLYTQVVFSKNPITNAKGVSDPHIRVFNDTKYLFSGHDASPTDKLWVMKDWRVFASTDLLDWNQVQTIAPADNYMDDNS